MARTHKHERQRQAERLAIAYQIRVLEAVGAILDLSAPPTESDYRAAGEAFGIEWGVIRERLLTL